MTREKSSTDYQVALLATGDEICNGDVVNSNSQVIAQRLFNKGIYVGTHMTVADQLTELETAITFLLLNHKGLVITGGLGPTSDDLTRQALSHVLQRQLIFDETTWQAIIERLNRFGYQTPPESNRQQALFPEGATIIPNPNGTAAGCMVKNGEQFIFMLPGPPAECIPMVDSFVLPALKSNHFQQLKHYDKWLLFGVSEAEIAEKLDLLAQPFDCMTGYRYWYPYIEFKLHSNNQEDFATLVPLIEKAIAPYLIGDGKYTASELLKKKIVTLDFPIVICDTATGGLLESILKTPETYSRLLFNSELPNTPETLQIKISGLKEFWQQENNTTNSTLEITFQYNNQQSTNKTTIPFRGHRIKQYAVEFIAWQVYDYLASRAKKFA